jgi:hypothetical protein
LQLGIRVKKCAFVPNTPISQNYLKSEIFSAFCVSFPILFNIKSILISHFVRKSEITDFMLKNKSVASSTKNQPSRELKELIAVTVKLWRKHHLTYD